MPEINRRVFYFCIILWISFLFPNHVNTPIYYLFNKEYVDVICLHLFLHILLFPNKDKGTKASVGERHTNSSSQVCRTMNLLKLKLCTLCNNLKFAPFEIDEKWFNYVFLCSWKYRKIKFFIKLKFIIGCSNIVGHTCWCICVFVLFGFNQSSKWIQTVLEMD